MDEGFSISSVNRFIELAKSGSEYNFTQIKKATGIDIGDIMQKQF